MSDFSCRKCGQVVGAEKMPHSCPRCYSAASEAYIEPAERKKSVELMFDVGTAFDGAPGWETSLDKLDAQRAPAPVRTVRTQELDEDDLEAATDRGLVRAAEAAGTPGRGGATARPGVPVPGSAAVTTQELDAGDIEAVIVARQNTRTTAPPPTPLAVPHEPREVPRRVAPATRPERPLRSSRSVVPPTQEVEPLPPRPRRQQAARQQTARQQTARQRRMPTAQTERVGDTLRARRQRRWLLWLWTAGGLVLAVGVLRMFVFTGEPLRGNRGSDANDPSLASASSPASSAAAPDAGLPTDLRVASRPDLARNDVSPAQVAQTTSQPTSDRSPSKPVTKPVTKPALAKKPVVKQPARKPIAKPAPNKPVEPVEPVVPRLAAAERRALAQRLYRQGLQQLLLGQTQASVSRFKRAAGADRGFALAYRGLGLAHQKLGEKALARAAYHRYLKLQPQASDAAMIRARLQSL